MFVYGIYESEEAAAKAVDELVNASFPTRDIGALMVEETSYGAASVTQRTGVARGAALGGAIGAIGGALLLPGAGLFAGGPLLVALQSAIASGVVGAGFGSIGGLGYWTENVEGIDRELGDGAIIVGVETHDGRRAEAEAALRSAEAKQVDATSQLPRE